MKMFAGLFLASLLIVVGCDSGASDPAASDPAAATQPGVGIQAGNDPAVESGTVTLEIQRSDSLATFEIADVQQGTTLEDVMRSVTQIPISIRGSGVTAFVDGIGEQSASGNEGWVFRVDGVHANQGVGSTVLTPPVTITWVFGDTDDLVVE
jgi:hypothetical protein